MHGKHIQFHKFGNPKDVLQVEYKNIEPLRDNEVLVRMLVRPINPSDLIPITGAYAHRIPLPNIPGYEGIGIVEDVGLLFLENLSANVFYRYAEKVLGRICENIS